ncbi:MAG TPA: glycosyltransferase [Candidatus Eisenbacteria bacterium]|nr:glycosyltransferase [Candidatus Eisenbacteria bacterium]
MFAWGLPEPPSEAELARQTPPIAPVAGGLPRPFWSVVIPTYNCATYLRRTLASVLEQDRGADAMQIAVVDDCSTADDPAAVVAELAAGRVTFTRNAQNLGPTATFNACVAHATGRWVHLLHGDDMVLPGFYAECEAIVAAHPDVVMILGQVVTVDEADRWTDVIGPEPRLAGTRIADFLPLQAIQQLGQFAGVVVRRDAYERAGGFCTAFGHVADRDMWFRVGRLGPVWCTSRPYGVYRVHGAADTGKHVVRATNTAESWLVTRVQLARLGADPTGAEATRFRKWLAHRAYRSARKLYARGELDGARNQLWWALRLDANARSVGLWARTAIRRALA